MIGSRAFMAAVTIFGVGVAAPGSARAQTANFSFTGSGVSGNFLLTYGAATDAKYPNAFEVTGISGSFTDTNNGLNIVNAPVTSLVPINYATPGDPLNVPLAPNDFSSFMVASGLPPQANGVLTFDNLLWPGGTPATCVDYPFFGGVLDVYGLMFDIGNGRVAGIWGNGANPPGGDANDYGVAVATANAAEDYVQGGVVATTTPEPGAVWLLGTGLAGLLFVVKRRRGKTGQGLPLHGELAL
ncbi:MAG: PEP-CTERM sorting domain-containing protein [Gemmatimonadaceae bacterium]